MHNPNPQCKHCEDMHDGFYGSYADPCPFHDYDGSEKLAPQEENKESKPMAKKSTRELLRAAKDASADLQTFGTIKSILEGSSAPRNMGQVGCYSHGAAVNKIIEICNAEIQRALKYMDAACEAVEQRVTQADKQKEQT